MRILVLILTLIASAAAPSHAWNGLGHKVVADIAWQQLDEPARKQIVETLRRHPRFDEDFAKQMPNDVDDARWIFQHAATWPDKIRGNRDYDHPTWHYVNFPTFAGTERPVAFNLHAVPAADPSDKWNVVQAFEFCRATIDGKASPDHKALAYCWMFHLVGDIHQPLHATALVCDRFPNGDKGGNSVLVVQGGKLHSLWDNLLGRQDRMTDVAREIAELRRDGELWKVDARPNFMGWVDESSQMARTDVYTPEILHVVVSTDDFRPIRLPEAYLENAGEVARGRVVAAGLRLGVLLGGMPTKVESPMKTNAPARTTIVPTPRLSSSFAPSSLAPAPAAASRPAMDYWLNTGTNVRHNRGCRYFEKTGGRPCMASDGKACGICGG